MSEKHRQAKIFKKLGGRQDVRLFRNNVGVAWLGKTFRINKPTTVTLQPGDVVVRKAQRVRYGLHNGSGDLIGWRVLTITPAMVGKRIAQFLSMEIKTPQGRVSDEQNTWAKVVNNMGGCAAVVRNEGEAISVLSRGVR